ncbi:MAG TPA: class I SAM-dependent rRNA methyltransferase [Gemmatimonadaceae bacterium]|jgi:23S rRNA (cytosine1962-C5)-methyltransferase|nr:class I SAM-dependent rRNA methyltransferase [Gemmatimonadaceae bacterium]
MRNTARITTKGLRRWESGHPWIYRSDVAERPDSEAGVVLVRDSRNRPLGWALWSPKSEISLRFIESNTDIEIDGDWWTERIERAMSRRVGLETVTNAYRVVHGEADGCPSLVVDRYDRWAVVQLMSAGLEAFRHQIIDAIVHVTRVDGILARNDAALRGKEGLIRETVNVFGEVPHEIEVDEYGIRYIAAPYTGQKTGAFLDQRENRHLAGQVAKGVALDCFSYHGSFALHLAQNADEVIALDSSAQALERAKQNAALNGIENIDFVETNAFDFLREKEDAEARFDTIVLDPPAFAKTRSSIPAALRGYKDINMRAMRLLTRGGMLFTASCSFHLSKSLFLDMLESAAADSGRRIALREIRAQPLDHPEILTIPETGYIKGALLEALD